MNSLTIESSITTATNISESKPTITFGTDGWRGLIAKDFTFANLEKVAQAYADFVNNENSVSGKSEKPSVVIGGDHRFLSEQFARRVAEILSANSINVALFEKPVPTPLVSWATRENQASGGVMITASHNPAEYNGFKIKAPWGGSAPQEITKAVESLIDRNSVRDKSEFSGSIDDVSDGESIQSYRRQIAELVDLDQIRASSVRVIVDSIHGVGGRWVESFLKLGNINCETIRAERNAFFGGVHPEPIDANLGALKTRVKSAGAILGLATDGDADRVGAVNELGETMTMHQVVPLMLLHLIKNRRMTGGIVRTFSQSVLIKRIAAAYNLPLYETPIGFKYVADLMLKTDILIGAEESGGIGVKGHIPERDGILNSLLLLEAVIAAKQTPTEMVKALHQEFGEFHYDRRDLHVEIDFGRELIAELTFNPPASVEGYEVAGIESSDGVKLLLEDESWILFRQSGTEPVLRVYSEATSIAKREQLLDFGCRMALKQASN